MEINDEGPPALPEGIRKEDQHYISLRDDASMVWIPQGPFFMGQPQEEIFAKSHEKPGRQVQLPGFFMDLFPTTNKRYKRFIEDKGYSKPEYWDQKGWDWIKEQKIRQPAGWDRPGFMEEDQPVAGVSWYEADAYARWAGKSLPTEAEWEKAARGLDGRRFPWGNDLPTTSYANFDQIKGCTSRVGEYPLGVSPYGCLDMAGNVNNWCQDWYWDGFYAFCKDTGLNSSPLLDSDLCKKIGVPTKLKVDRGGGFATAFQYLEILSCTDKVAWPPTTRDLWNGFRCALVLG